MVSLNKLIRFCNLWMEYFFFCVWVLKKVIWFLSGRWYITRILLQYFFNFITYLIFYIFDIWYFGNLYFNNWLLLGSKFLWSVPIWPLLTNRCCSSCMPLYSLITAVYRICVPCLLCVDWMNIKFPQAFRLMNFWWFSS